MALKMSWQSGSDCGVVEICVPQTDKDKLKFAEYVLAAAKDGWCISIFVEHLNDDDYE